MKDTYEKHLPAKDETIVQKIISHFISYVASERGINITFEGIEDVVALGDILKEKCKQLSSQKFDIEKREFNVSHLAISRRLSEGGATHRLFFEANGRIVREESIGLPLGLSTYLELDGEKYVYAGVISGSFLDENVNSERTNFDISREDFNAIKNEAIAQARSELGADIERVVKQQTELVRGVLRKYPRYTYLYQAA
jgi:hypothetical protein